MAPIEVSDEVDRPVEQVFAYVTDPSRFGEWQQGVVSGRMDGGGVPRVGQKCLTTRRIGFAERPVTAELAYIDPPRTWGVRGIDGPIRSIVDVTVDPLDDGARSRVTIRLDFVGHGIGKLLVPLVVRPQSRKEMPANLAALRRQLENQPAQRK
ncbi:SRPBCC family protein [Nocardia colli]|uniref:SRPBCC family protein n=1 Tax=Nocardia colli TaxID=2545717 RepID=A0A5N0DXK3_9NOCA|nr:SRPBCC family protein [Nocardia colli]KAA8881852.1 SRPBCC family protein [Nocardia colli]